MRAVFKKSLLAALIIPYQLLGQNFDTSNNGALHGDYFIREILIGGENANGSITSAMSTMGLVTFDGAGNYTFKGSSTGNAIRGNVLTTGSSGTYAVGSNGLLYIQSLVDTTQYAYGGVSAIGPSAFAASATEGSSVDILVAIPAGGTVTASALNGNYSAGYIAFPNADVTMVREASLSLTADGAGNLANVAVTGAAQNLGGNTVNQTVSGATYTLSGEGSGTLNLGSASTSQVVSGSVTLYVSADGNLFVGGTPGGYDLIVGMKAFSGSATNATWKGEYFTGAIEDTVGGTGTAATHALDSFYGSWNANGQGISIAHDRFQALMPAEQVFDYTFDSTDSVQANGTVSPSDVPYTFTLGVGGKAFIATGTGGVYSLMVGFGAPVYSGTGVYLNPLGVVNAANYAPITNPIAPGEILALYGSGLAPSTMSATALPLPTSLGGVQVTVNGTPAPLFYVTPGQIAIQVPQAITPGNNVANATIQVTNNGVVSNAVTVYTNYTAPGVFSAGGNGVGSAAAQNGTNFSLISASNPIKAGSTAVLYATGLGTVNANVGDGAAAPSNPPAAATDTDYVYVGGQQENLAFDGLTPGLAGLFQLNTTIMAGTPTGTVFADISTPDAYTSEATLAVGGSAGAMDKVHGMKARPAAKKTGLARRSAPRVIGESR
jgi:uncharacterized protein (TIGR03437 family)